MKNSSIIKTGKQPLHLKFDFIQQIGWSKMRSFLLIAVCAVSTPTRATTYYVDYANGNDANDGTSTNTAWKHCPGDWAATGNCPAGYSSLSGITYTNNPQPGDTVVFKGGVIYSLEVYSRNNIYGHSLTNNGICPNTSGAVGNSICYDGTGNNWGQGRAIIDGGYLAASAAFVFNPGISYYSVMGFEIRNFGGYPNENAANTVDVSAAGITCNLNTNIVFSGLLIDRIGQWQNNNSLNADLSSGVGIIMYSPDSVTITNCEFTRIGKIALGLYAGDKQNVGNVTVVDCYLHDFIWNWGIDVKGGNSSRMHDIAITRTRLVNCPTYNWLGINGNDLHLNGLFIGSNGFTNYWTNITVSRCLFADTNSAYNSAGGTGSIYLSGGPSVNIFNNIFSHAHVNNGNIEIGFLTFSNQTSIVRIYNNTFQRASGSGSVIENGFSPSYGTNINIDIKNNLVLEDSAIPANAVMLNFNDVGANPSGLDYNLYFSKDWSVSQKYVAYAPGPKFFSALQPLGFETHGHYNDPTLFNNSGWPILSRDYHPMTNSIAIGAGTNLSRYFSDDFEGNSRPASGAWTIGAYDGASGAPLVTLIASQTTVSTGQATTLSWSTANTTNLTLNGFGSIPLSGSTNIVPLHSTNFSVTAMGPNGVRSANVFIQLKLAPPSGLQIQPH